MSLTARRHSTRTLSPGEEPREDHHSTSVTREQRAAPSRLLPSGPPTSKASNTARRRSKVMRARSPGIKARQRPRERAIRLAGALLTRHARECRCREPRGTWGKVGAPANGAHRSANVKEWEACGAPAGPARARPYGVATPPTNRTSRAARAGRRDEPNRLVSSPSLTRLATWHTVAQFDDCGLKRARSLLTFSDGMRVNPLRPRGSRDRHSHEIRRWNVRRVRRVQPDAAAREHGGKRVRFPPRASRARRAFERRISSLQ